MQNPLISKLEYGAGLTDADRTVLAGLTRHTYRAGARQDIIREGERPEAVHIVLEGFACRYKVLRHGAREIVALFVPGDICDLHVAVLDAMDHGIATLSSCTVVDISRGDILDLMDHHPRITRALWWSTLVDEGILREWVAGLGLRAADQRMAHLFCELLVRLQTVGLATANSYKLPLSQGDLGEVLGISAVHVNRTLQHLREADLFVFDGKRVTIPDVEKIKAYCQFNPNYLHLTKRQIA